MDQREQLKTVTLSRSILDRLRVQAAIQKVTVRELGDKILDKGLKKLETT